MDEFFSWASDLCVLPRSKLGEAVAYLLKYKEGLCTFLEDGRLETTNNRAERAIKELVIGRKNWLFSKSEKGAQATGIILSILRTAVENGLDPRKYLIYLFEKIPNLPSLTKTALAAFLPWDQEVQKIAGPIINGKSKPINPPQEYRKIDGLLNTPYYVTFPIPLLHIKPIPFILIKFDPSKTPISWI